MTTYYENLKIFNHGILRLNTPNHAEVFWENLIKLHTFYDETVKASTARSEIDTQGCICFMIINQSLVNQMQ